MQKVKMFRVLPTLLTLGNAVCGFGAITFAAKVGPESLEARELFIAAILIYLAMLFDMLDGRAARWAKHTTDFGAQLDSLCDAVSFGIAPAFLMLRFMQPQNATPGGEMFFHYPPRLLWVIAALFVACALLRRELKLRDLTAYDVMVPRADIAAVPVDVELADLVQVMSTKGHSRLPVYRETLDDVVGMVHIKDVLTCMVGERPFDLQSIVREGGIDVFIRKSRGRDVLGACGQLGNLPRFYERTLTQIECRC